jgi:tetratricopeptide (TPR) repeat protein
MINSNKGNGDDLDTDFDDLNDLPDFDDSDEGIFAPEPQKKKTSAQMNLIAGVAAVAIAVGAGYMFLLKPQAVVTPEVVSQLEPSVTPPDTAAANVAPPAATEPPQPQPESPPVQTEATLMPPADQVDPSSTVTPPAALTPESQTAAVVEAAPPVPADQTPPQTTPASEQAAGEEPQAAAAVVQPATVTPLEPTPETAAEQKAEDAADATTETAKAEPQEPPVTPQPASPPSEPAVTPPDQAALKDTADEEKKAEETSVADIELPAAQETPQAVSVAEKKPEKKSDKKEDVKKEQEKLTYFDSPPGQALRDIPPPSINPNIAPGESIIIVQKDMGSPEGVVVEKSPQTARIESQLIAGGRAVKLGRYDAALEIYNSLYQMNPRDGRILMGRALTLQKMGEVAAAISGYEELLSLDPNNVDATVNLMGLIRKEYPAVALEKLLDLRQRYPNSSAIAAQLGVAYADAGNVDSALRYLGMASQMQPQNPLHIYNMAVLADRAGKREQAIGFYERALEIDAVYGTGRAFSRERVYDRLARLRGN